jgi:hypothetical protein
MKKFQTGNKMASTRKRTTTKTGNFTKRTVTISKNGTRITNSFRPPGGQTRRTTSVNLRTGQNRTTYTTHFGGGWSTTRSKSTSIRKVGSGRSSRNSDGDEIVFAFIFGFFAWIYSLIFGNEEKEKEIVNKESKEILYQELLTLTPNQQKILMYDVLNIWIDADDISEEHKEKIFNYDWKNFDFNAWRKENGFEDKSENSQTS